MHDTDILIGWHVWSRQNDSSWIMFIFPLPVNMTLNNNSTYMEWFFISVTLKDLSNVKVTTENFCWVYLFIKMQTTSSFVSATLILGRKKSAGTEPYSTGTGKCKASIVTEFNRTVT